jgi:hypothetical protein
MWSLAILFTIIIGQAIWWTFKKHDLVYDLLIIYELGRTDEQIHEFWNTVISTEQKRLFHLMHLPPIKNHAAIGIQFYKNVSSKDRLEIKASIERNTDVYITKEKANPTNIQEINSAIVESSNKALTEVESKPVDSQKTRE